MTSRSPTMPRILSIAGSDSGGGAGIQADIKTITTLGGFAMTAITAITAQNTCGVQAVHPVPTDIIRQQITSTLDDIGADAIKIGMLGTVAIIECVHETLRNYPGIPIILDPVMQAKGGAALLDEDALDALHRLISRVTLVTPNLPEATALTGQPVTADNHMQHAAEALNARHSACAVLVKGGHLEGDTLTNALLMPDGHYHRITSQRIDTRHTHGTGCTLSAAIATYIGHGHSLPDAVSHATDYVQGTVEHAPGFGSGHGPMRHNYEYL